jgi:DNA-binding GntR family transcriptional regulator
MNEADLDEIIEARVILESAAARRVSEIWSAEDTEWVQANIDAQKGATTLSDLSRLDVELHLYVMRRAGNGRLLRMWQILRWQFQMCVAMAHRLQATLAFKPHQITVEAHLRLLKALASGNPALAAATMAAHIENAKEWTHGNSGFGSESVSSVAASIRRLCRGSGRVF